MLVVSALALGQLACYAPLTGSIIERHLDRSFTVPAGAVVRVNVSGASVTATTGPAGRVSVALDERIHADSDAEADDILSHYEISATQEGNEVVLTARRTSVNGLRALLTERVDFANTRLTVPADARLDLRTSGGGIAIHGDRTADVRADTSGGSVRIDGGRGQFQLRTSGGSIAIGQALGAVSAHTSGGSISIDYVGPAATDLDVGTSGGGIRVGIDPDASLAITAGTSGGGVHVAGLPLVVESEHRSHLSARLNGGAGRLRASTSGGGITLRAAPRE